MAFSYSFHLSAKNHAVPTKEKVLQVSKHNLRKYKSSNYDRMKIEILKGNNRSILEDVKRIYHTEFDNCLAKYNAKAREDRRIKDYLSHVSDSRNDVACEIIIQIGDKDFWKDKTLEERRQMTPVFRDQLRSLEKLVPELKVASAVIHYDESSPHMHIVGVPVAEGYKKGLEKQVAKTKVFTASRLSFLQDKMRENAERGMHLEANQNLFAEMQLKEKELGRNKDFPKWILDKYNRLTKEVEANEEMIAVSSVEIAQMTDKMHEVEKHTTDAENSLKTAHNALEAISGKIEDELLKRRFRDWSTMEYGKDYEEYRQKGELLALYADGTVRRVGYNKNHGWDDQTLDDLEAGLCRVGIIEKEASIRIPLSLMREIVRRLERTKGISDDLKKLIRYFKDLDTVLDRNDRSR